MPILVYQAFGEAPFQPPAPPSPPVVCQQQPDMLLLRQRPDVSAVGAAQQLPAIPAVYVQCDSQFLPWQRKLFYTESETFLPVSPVVPAPFVQQQDAQLPQLPVRKIIDSESIEYRQSAAGGASFRRTITGSRSGSRHQGGPPAQLRGI